MATRHRKKVADAYESSNIEERMRLAEDKLTELSQYADTSADGAGDEDVGQDTADDTSVIDNVDMTDTSCIIVVTIPRTKKVAQFEKVLRKVFENRDVNEEHIGSFDKISIPLDDSGKTIGYGIIVYKSKQSADLAVAILSGTKVGKKEFPLVARSFAKIKEVLDLPATYKEPDQQQFTKETNIKTTSSTSNLQEWLLDKRFRDQFIVRFGAHPEDRDNQDKELTHETHVMWAENFESKPQLEMSSPEEALGKSWCDWYVNWSPRGTYLATLHHKGIKLWGGKDFKMLGRVRHDKVQFLNFTPDERYIFSWDGVLKNSVKLCNVSTMKVMKKFHIQIPKQVIVNEKDPLGVMKVSPSSKYVAWISKKRDRQGNEVDLLSIFELPKMNLLNSTSISLPGITSFAWSPKEDYIAFWTPAQQNYSARVAILDVKPMKKGSPLPKLQEKFLVNVVDCKLKWHPQGDFLAACVTRHPRNTKKKTFTNFEIFRMRDNGIPVEMFELQDGVLDFEFESKGVRIGVIHAENRQDGVTSSNPDVSFYTMGKKRGGKKVELLHTYKDTSCNKLYWSPMGNFVVLAGLGGKPHNGRLEFYDVDDACSLTKADHAMCSTVQWDPSGRICATAVTQLIGESASMAVARTSGYQLWSFTGKSLHTERQHNFYSFEWRPRPPSVLSEDDKKDIMKNKKDWTKQFAKQDMAKENKEKALFAYDMHRQIEAFREEYRRLVERSGEYKFSPHTIMSKEYIDILDERVESA
eukprot:g187.t1